MQLEKPSDVDERLFRSNLPLGDARELFSRYVRNINLEVFDHCNRQCPYCPVSLVDRRSTVRRMAPGHLTGLVDELALIGYAGAICLNLFNEPLADEEATLAAADRLRNALPAARIWFTTNGDYLDRAVLDRLAAAGLKRIVVSLHFTKGETYDDLRQLTRLNQLAARTGVAFTVTKMKPGKEIKAEGRHKGVPITVKTVDYMIHGVNRGDSLVDIPIERDRQTPCDRPFHEVSIGWNGAVYPCCQFLPGLAEHDRYVAGTLEEAPITQVYASAMMAGFREGNFGYGPKLPPCSTCGDRDVCRGDPDRAMRQAVAEALGLDGTGTATAGADVPTGRMVPAG